MNIRKKLLGSLLLSIVFLGNLPLASAAPLKAEQLVGSPALQINSINLVGLTPNPDDWPPVWPPRIPKPWPWPWPVCLSCPPLDLGSVLQQTYQGQDLIQAENLVTQFGIDQFLQEVNVLKMQYDIKGFEKAMGAVYKNRLAK